MDTAQSVILVLVVAYLIWGGLNAYAPKAVDGFLKIVIGMIIALSITAIFG